jgi:hypothetical protein
MLQDGELLWFSKGPVPKYIFRGDGSAISTAADDSERIDMRWHIDSRSRFVCNLSTDADSRLRYLWVQVRDVIGVERDVSLVVWCIRELSSDRIVLDSVNRPGAQQILQRISRTTLVP